MRYLLLVGLLAIASSALGGTPFPDAPHIVISGEGKAFAKPDSVRLSFEFESRSLQPLSAKREVDQAVDRLLSRLDGFQIGDDDIRAGDIQTSEDVDYTDTGKRVSNGYEANRTVTVLLKHLDHLNGLIDAGLSSGAKRFRNLGFESTQAAVLRSEAKRQAIDNARLQAAETAGAFGAVLGPIYSIDSVNSRMESRYRATALDTITVTGSAAAPGRYVQPIVEYTETVNAVFELKR